MRALGAEIDYRDGYNFARAPGRLRGTHITYPGVTLMGTENAILAAALAEGRTVIRPAAREPEVDDLIAFLQTMGADVERTAPDTIEIAGKRRLRGGEHRVIPDRIEAGTFIIATAITGGDVILTGAPCANLGAFLDVIAEVGVQVACGRDTIEVRGAPAGSGEYRCADIRTAPYPGLATDLQPPTGVLLSQATGRSNLHETIFEDRLEWLSELGRMGAPVEMVSDHHAMVTGPARLTGTDVSIGDLRAGASLILAALVADGTSTIHGAHHVRRGYENIERKFLELGARIEHVSEDSNNGNGRLNASA
jgi:UDP-N-acetylglucosamine 1-carboxyvinyltransferase